MLSPAMWNALNEQVKWELESSYLYLGMAAWFNGQALAGFAQWMRTQADEETAHAMKFYHYIEQRGNRVELLPFSAPPKTWESALNVIETSYRHEQKVTGLIDNLVKLAAAEKDRATSDFLKWFVAEQMEEEQSFLEVLDKLKSIKPGNMGMTFLDKRMGERK